MYYWIAAGVSLFLVIQFGIVGILMAAVCWLGVRWYVWSFKRIFVRAYIFIATLPEGVGVQEANARAAFASSDDLDRMHDDALNAAQTLCNGNIPMFVAKAKTLGFLRPSAEVINTEKLESSDSDYVPNDEKV